MCKGHQLKLCILMASTLLNGGQAQIDFKTYLIEISHAALNYEGFSPQGPFKVPSDSRLMTWIPCFLMLIDLMIALQSTGTHDIILKNLT